MLEYYRRIDNMNQNETKLDLVNPMSPNQIIKSEIITENQNTSENIENNTTQNLNNQVVENNIVQDVNNQPNEQKPKKKFNLILIDLFLLYKFERYLEYKIDRKYNNRNYNATKNRE